MAQYVAIRAGGEQSITPLLYKPSTVTPRFVRLSDSSTEVLEHAVEELTTSPSTSAVAASEEPVDVAMEPDQLVMDAPALITPEPEEEQVLAKTEPVLTVSPQPAPTPAPAPVKHTPLSINLLSIRRTLGLTPEEFARPIIEDGEGLINRLEAGFSRASAEVGHMICDAWNINSSYLYTGTGAMFEKDGAVSPAQYCDRLVSLLKTYLSVATMDTRGRQYWKGSLVTDLLRLIDVNRLDSKGMARVARIVFDYLDVDQFTEMLERMGMSR